MVSEQILNVFSWTSWGSIFAGGVAAVGVSIVMAVFGVALGFTVLDPKANDPAAGLGLAFGAWSFISVVASMAVGGFVAGLAAGRHGVEHGFLVWALVLITATLLSGIATSSALRTLGSTVKTLGSGTAEVISSVGKGAAQAASGAVAELRDSINLHVDSEKLTRDIGAVLRDTGIETLQPDYLQGQMREARSDVRNALHQLTLEPGNSDQIISAFLQKQEQRLSALADGVDNENAVEALMRVRNVPRNEAEKMLDNAIGAYEQVVSKAREALSEAREQVQDAREYLKTLSVQAREKADNLASTAAKAALAAGLALLVAAAVSMGAGAWGASHSTDWYTVQKSFVIR